MRTRTAPSERPRMAAISAVDISCDEAQDHGPPAIAGQPIDRRARPTSPPRGRPRSPRCRAGRRRRARDRAEPRVGGAAGGVARRSTLRAIRKSQTRNVEASLPSVGARALLEPGQRRQRGQERPLGGVLRLVVIARARRPRSCTPGPRTSDTGRRTGAGSAAQPPRATDRGRGGRAERDRPPSGRVPPSSMPVGPWRYTPPGAATGAASRTWTISPTRTARRRRRIDQERAADPCQRRSRGHGRLRAVRRPRGRRRGRW